MLKFQWKIVQFGNFDLAAKVINCEGRAGVSQLSLSATRRYRMLSSSPLATIKHA